MPTNHQLYSAFVQEDFVVSKKDLMTHAINLVGSEEQPQLTWRSKPLSLKIWCSKWNKVYWLPHLFGRTLKPSSQIRLENALMEYLEVIHASHSLLQETGKEQMIHDTYGHISEKVTHQSREQLNLFFASSKTSPDTSHLDMKKSETIYSALVTQLRKEYSQRLKLVHHTKEKDSSSLQSKTTNWQTPRVPRGRIGPSELSRNSPELETQVLSGQPDQEKSNLNGNRLVLNPAWVLQLMGTRLEKTFFAWREMGL